MNKLNQVFLLLLFVIFTSACDGGKKSLLTKKWKVSEFTSKEMDKNNQEMKKMLQEMIKDNFFEFKKDGTYEMKFLEETEKGKWQLVDSDKKLQMIKDGKTDKQVIDLKELSDKKVVLGDDKASITITLIPS